jgi:hypothetical protein
MVMIRVIVLMMVDANNDGERGVHSQIVVRVKKVVMMK